MGEGRSILGGLSFGLTLVFTGSALASTDIQARYHVATLEAQAGLIFETLWRSHMATQKHDLKLGQELPTSKQELIPTEDFLIEEFSIMELEDRLELQARCNNNCSCAVGD